MPAIVRRATESDLPAMIEMARRFILETPYERQIAYNPEQIERFGRWLMSLSNGILAVLEVGGVPQGMVGAITVVHPFSAEVVASELFWWVNPEHRGDGLKLLREFRRWGKEMGATALNMVAPNDQVAKVYERLGFKWIEAMYGREL